MRPFISARGVSKTFGEGASGVEALAEISFDFPRNRFVSIVGHSGCGKSTLLRVLAGLEPPSRGTVEIDGLAPRDFARDRPFGFVFQDSALLPWKTARQNIRLPLDILRLGKPSQRDARAQAFIDLAHLTGFEDTFPAHLSGGMRQRVSLARSLVYAPDVLLMDEPFGALDDFTRREMGDELLRIWAERQCTVMFVTHSLSEAVLLSDHVIVLKPRPGRIDAILDITLDRPRTRAARSSEAFAACVRRLEERVFGADA